MRCDFLFAADRGKNKGWIAFIEMTSGQKSAKRVIDQLKGGMKIAKDIIPTTHQVEYRFIFVGNMNRAESKRLKMRANYMAFQDSGPTAIQIIANKDQISRHLTE